MRVQSPIAGNLVGTAGGMVFQHYNGRTYGRALPVIFHYQPTPAQAAAQDKYYGIRRYWLPTYRIIKPFVPDEQLKLANAYNDVTKAVYRALGVFDENHTPEVFHKFGFDPYHRLSLWLGNYTLYYEDPYYYITFWDFHFESDVNFTPVYAHALYLCPDLQEIQYCAIDYNADHLTFIFVNSRNWFPDHTFEMYVALSDDEYFSNFFY